MPYIGKIAYVANSANTVYQGTYSAGRLYDKIADFAFARIMFITHAGAIAAVLPEGTFEGYKEQTEIYG